MRLKPFMIFFIVSVGSLTQACATPGATVDVDTCTTLPLAVAPNPSLACTLKDGTKEVEAFGSRSMICHPDDDYFLLIEALRKK